MTEEIPSRDYTHHALAVSSRGTIAHAASGGMIRIIGPGETAWYDLQEIMCAFDILAFAPDGSRLLCIGIDHCSVFVFDMDTSPPRQMVVELTSEVHAAWIDRDTIRVFDLCLGLVQIDIHTGERINLGETDGGCRLYSRTTGPFITCSDDGQWLACGGLWNEATDLHLCHLPSRRWWDLRTSEEVIGAKLLQFTASGQLLHIDFDNILSLWDPTTRHLLGSLHFDVGHPWGQWFASTDGERVAYLAQGTIHVWDWRPLLESR